MSNFPNAEKFFWTARERHAIYLRRLAGASRPWTGDPIFHRWSFCNVFRELDRTTIWFRENVRSHVSGLEAVRATVCFRWFNRIETCEQVKDLLLTGWDSDIARERLRYVSPVVTGAYIIKGMDGYDKLNGVLECIDLAFPHLSEMYYRWENNPKHESGVTLEEAWSDLCRIHYLGRFMAYEIVSDLRWTDVLYHASDIRTWANAGPGCTRGLRRVTGNHDLKYTSDESQIEMLAMMRELLQMSYDPQYWPLDWPRWEMREVEHWLCEFAKYCHAEEGNRLKRKYHER